MSLPLATATGQQLTWHDQVPHTALGAARAALPSGDREAAFTAMVPNLPAHVAANGRPFRNPTDPGHDAPLIDQLIAWYGRNP